MELVNFTCEWPNSQLDPPLVASLCRLVVDHWVPLMSFGTVVNWSQVTLEMFMSCKILRDTGNLRRSRPGRRSLANPKHHRSVGGRSQVYHGGRAVVVVLGPEFMPIELRMACEGCELVSQSWCSRKSLLLHGQLYTFCLLVCQSLPEIDVKASLRSDDKSLTSPRNPEFFNS